ncbi:MAG: hypothetical protein JRN52_00085 [Nitrososphaerota archaeon]|nr:hypothetical protein [Nitrososphaerota archaeon]
MIRPSLFTPKGEFVIGSKEKHLVVLKYNAQAGGVNALVDGKRFASRGMIDFRMVQDVLEFHLGEREQHNILVIKALRSLPPIFKLLVDAKQYQSHSRRFGLLNSRKSLEFFLAMK